jgi:hypothetical protein
MAQTGQSEAIHSPEEWASTVVRLTVPVFWLRSARHGRTIYRSAQAIEGWVGKSLLLSQIQIFARAIVR